MEHSRSDDAPTREGTADLDEIDDALRRIEAVGLDWSLFTAAINGDERSDFICRAYARIEGLAAEARWWRKEAAARVSQEMNTDSEILQCLSSMRSEREEVLGILAASAAEGLVAAAKRLTERAEIVSRNVTDGESSERYRIKDAFRSVGFDPDAPRWQRLLDAVVDETEAFMANAHSLMRCGHKRANIECREIGAAFNTFCSVCGSQESGPFHSRRKESAR